MTCEELKARLNSQKGALLRIQAQEIAAAAGNSERNLYAEYLEAKSAYENALRQLYALSKAVRG